jgi:hypothetical protein
MGEEVGRDLLTVVSTDGRRSAGEIGRLDQAEVQPYERTTEDPHPLQMAQAQRSRRARERPRSR